MLNGQYLTNVLLIEQFKLYKKYSYTTLLSESRTE